jgi:preprotein translocase subunit Sec63
VKINVKDYYSILGVDEEAQADEIKSAYRSQVKIWHPDISTLSGAHERFIEISEAYEVLSDETTRKKYDNLKRYELYGEGEAEANASVGRKVLCVLKWIISFIVILVSLFIVSLIAYDVYNKLQEVPHIGSGFTIRQGVALPTNQITFLRQLTF